LGLTVSETVHLLYRQIKLQRGLPFDVRIPNELNRPHTQREQKGQRRQTLWQPEGTLRRFGLVRTSAEPASSRKMLNLRTARQEFAKFKAVIDLLIDGEVLPPQYKDHPLRGNFAAGRDCQH